MCMFTFLRESSFHDINFDELRSDLGYTYQDGMNYNDHYVEAWHICLDPSIHRATMIFGQIC